MKQLAGKELEAFRKLEPAAAIKQIRGQRGERNFQVERDTIDKEARTAWFSIASERPYERWWGIEILDHGKKSIRGERLDNGANFLVGHDTDDVVGVVEKWEVGSDKKLRILVRFGRSARAEEIFQDVLDGIRRNTSVGYVIHDLVLEKSEEGVNTYRVTDWEPLEGSLVAIPADPSVGQGRSLEAAPPNQLTEDIMTPEEKAKIEAEVRAKVEAELKAKAEQEAKEKAERENAANALKREQDRVSALLAAGDQFKDLGGGDLARELIKDPNATVDTFKARMADKMRGTHRPTQTAEPGQQPGFGSGARHILRHGQLRAFTKPILFSDGYRMEPVEAAYRSGQWLLATVGQQARAMQWCRDNGLGEHLRVMTTESGPSGGYLVPDEMEQSIIDLRATAGLARRLCRRRAMSGDTLSVPKRTGGVTAYFVNEDNSGVTESEKNWGNVNFMAKTLAALTRISKNLEEDAIIDVVDDLAMEMAYAFAVKEDQCWLIGDGTSTYGGMKGIKWMMDNGTYKSNFVAATNHDTFAEYDNADLSGVMAATADFPGMNPSWVCSKTFAENVFGRLKRTAGGNNGADLDRRYTYGYGGYPADTTDIMPKEGTSDSTTVEALFGDFSKSSSFADRRGIVIEVLRERYAEMLQLGIIAHERFHIVNHDLGDANNKGPVASLKGQ